MKLYLTNIQINYNEFYNSLKSIGYSEAYPSRISNKRQLEEILNQLLEDILIFNDLLNIFDYSQQEKSIILKSLNNIGKRKTTILYNLVQINTENYSEDESIDMEYSDVYLFESQKQETMNNNDFQMILNESQQQFDELKENNILKGVDKVLTAGAKILSSKNNALGRLSKSKLNEGFNIGNTKKAEAKGYKSGAKDGMKVGAVGGAVAGAAVVGAGVAAYHGGKKLINKVKETFGKKKPTPKKMNQSLDDLAFQAQQQYVDDSSLDNSYEWDFTEDELENPLFENNSKFGRRKINQQLDLDELADQARQNHQQTVQLFESTKFNLDKFRITVDEINYDESFDQVNFNIYLRNTLDNISTIYHILWNFDDPEEFYIDFDYEVVEMLNEEGEDTELMSYSSNTDNIKKYSKDFQFIHKNLQNIIRRANIKSIY